VLLILQAILLYVYITNTVNKSALKDAQELASKISQQLDFKVRELSNISEGLLINGDFISILKSGPATTPMKYLEFNRKMVNIMNTVNTPSIIAKRIFVFKGNNLYYYTGQDTVDDNEVLERLTKLKWINKLNNIGGEKLLLPIHTDDWSKSEELCFSVARNILDQNGKLIGRMEIQQDYSQLNAICLIDPKIGSVLVLDHEGTLVYPYSTTVSKLQKTYTQYPIFSYPNNRENGTFTYKNGDNANDVYAYFNSAYSGWKVLIKISNGSNSISAKSILILNIALSFLLILGLLIIVVNRMTHYLLRPLKNLTESIGNVSLDNLAISVDQFDNEVNEITFLNNAFSKMFLNLEKSMAQVLESRTNEAKAQILALQSQMNPHFIYNTISMIESLSYTSGNRKVAELCRHFSSMLRYVSDFRNNDVTLREELENIKDYSILMESRYEEYLKFSTNIDDLALDIKIPKLIIQPLVENSIEHGVFKVNPPWYIAVDVGLSGDNLVISVSDNGCGINAEKIGQIKAMLAECDTRMNKYGSISNLHIDGMAIANIYSRLKLLYTDNFSIDFENLEPTGCKVIINICNIIKGDEIDVENITR
jgi:Predicted signal transduction protein with a C-terminal ATPase domain